jgi:hypothetical protein
MKPTSSLLVGAYRHLKLTTKDVNKGFYKGNRTGSMGRHTRFGGYIIEWHKVRTYAVPEDLASCKVCSPSLIRRLAGWKLSRRSFRGEVLLTHCEAHAICQCEYKTGEGCLYGESFRTEGSEGVH